MVTFEPVQEILVLIALLSNKGFVEPVQICSLVRAFAATILKSTDID